MSVWQILDRLNQLEHTIENPTTPLDTKIAAEANLKLLRNAIERTHKELL